MTSRVKGVTAFLALSFGLAWGGMFAAVLAFDLPLTNPIVQILTVAFTPAIAGFAVRKWVMKEGFADAGLRPRLRGNARLYLAAWLGPFVFAGSAVGLGAALGLLEFDPSAFELARGLPWWVSIGLLAVVVIVATPLYWGEEFGWTSYLRLRLIPERPLLSTLLTGLIWAVWHYPLAFLGYLVFDDVIAGLAVWTLLFLAQEVILTWLRFSTGSVWAASLAHAGNNLVLFTLLGAALGDDPYTSTLLALAPTLVFALWLILSGRASRELPDPAGRIGSHRREYAPVATGPRR